MASLFRPKIVTYRLKDGAYRTPDGKRVTSKTPGAVRTVERAKKWYGRYTDGKGKPHRVPLSESKETARRMLAKVAGDAQLASVGIVDKFARHRHTPLKEHAADFGRWLAARGTTAKYQMDTVARLVAVIEGCKFEYPDDLQPSAVAEFLAGLRAPSPALALDPEKEWYTTTEAAPLLGIRPRSLTGLVVRGPLPGPAPLRAPGRPLRLHRDTVAGLGERRTRGLGIKTSNYYLAAVKGFSKWLVKDGRAEVDPLAHLGRLNADTDVRHQRRALREADFLRFLEATAAGKTFRKVKGADRIVLYTLAANTGFRAKELASLTPRSFHLDATPPTVTVQASCSKRRRQDVQPLRADVAELMRQYVAGKPAALPLWPGRWKMEAAQMVRRDLAAAGIPYEDSEGRLFDFHSTRGQFISLLAAGGVHPKVAMVLARHSTITLTMDYYTHLDVFDVTGALDSLPGMPGPAAPNTTPEANPAAGGKAQTRRDTLKMQA